MKRQKRSHQTFNYFSRCSGSYIVVFRSPTHKRSEMEDEMVSLREVDITNFDEAINLKRKSTLYVGGPEYVLAEAYVYRGDSTACAIYADDIMVGMVIVRDHPRESCLYSFTDIFIADDYQRKGYGQAAVEALMHRFREERLRDHVEIQVHRENEPALRI